jgi:hypothetical protein
LAADPAHDGEHIARQSSVKAGNAVDQRRAEHRLLPWRSPAKYRLWTPAEDKLLGTMPDPQLAAKLGRSRSSVQHHRKQYHLPPFEPEAVLKT